MKCHLCEKEFLEQKIELSHDVPCYLFLGLNRKASKNQADKFGRHWLCKECHKYYEELLNTHLISQAVKFSEEFFEDA